MLNIFPSKGGLPVPTLESYFLEQLSTSSEYIDVAIDFLKDYPKVGFKIFNIHTVKDPVETFICEGLPREIPLCPKLRDVSFKDRNVAPKSYFWADRLAIAAYENGMIPEASDRHTIQRKGGVDVII
mmetsp:Transcript_31703/g.36419  ORF Transcript_31703/g.36419 Transcript_31703/m.36419 type:complete len:127 (-) Transcript_31703:354-734(-)